MHVHNIIFQRGVTFPALFLALADNNTMVRYDTPIMDPTTYTITTSQTSREVLSTYGTYHSRNFAAERYV